MSVKVILPAPRKHKIAAPAAAIAHAWTQPPPNPVLGLIDNAKPRAADLLDAIGRNLVRRTVVGSYFVLKKPSSGVTITAEDRAGLRARAHLIVSGIGD
jgi:hypothetical protein